MWCVPACWLVWSLLTGEDTEGELTFILTHRTGGRPHLHAWPSQLSLSRLSQLSVGLCVLSVSVDVIVGVIVSVGVSVSVKVSESESVSEIVSEIVS